MKEVITPRRGTEIAKSLVEWANERLDTHFSTLTSIPTGLMEGKEIRAVSLLTEFTKTGCNMHIASDGTRAWGNREFAYKVFAYPFLKLKKRRVTGIVHSTNHDALRFDKHLGFIEEGRVREALIDGDMVVLGMLARECRFIRPEFVRRLGKELPVYVEE